ncbi:MULTISPECIES: type I-E CRISPR-associated protein Cas6/Cse3/CasE [unclassified Endozoicomonas]|uniref:type I-E CRISPR-associated protein Cas6/Cse3/CasE n=1 Tax=unclassified Endozoicomonas TaxID=2644528 RepID=UPI00214823C9|nr:MULTISPECIES: type I-E CRISPR-associated protein Cas6/Cse3/CasE [unclassified Endozoicomonas]
MYLSRIQLTPALLEQTQLGKLLRRDSYGMHQLLWDVFPDGQYLFREENSHKQLGTRQQWPLFYVLSAHAPADNSPLFQIDCKTFQPKLKAGDRLAFQLRANPTIARRQQGKKNSARHDVVMDAKFQHLLQKCLEHGVLSESDIYTGAEGERRVLRNNLNRKQLKLQLFSLAEFKQPENREVFMRHQLIAIDKAATGWLEKKAESGGFKLESTQATGYLWHSLSDAKQKRNAGYSSMDYQGVLQITNENLFWEQLQKGFGQAKRFGCGLMLIRRLEG